MASGSTCRIKASMIFMQGLRGRTGAQLVFYMTKIAGMISRGSIAGSVSTWTVTKWTRPAWTAAARNIVCFGSSTGGHFSPRSASPTKRGFSPAVASAALACLIALAFAWALAYSCSACAVL